MGNKNVTVAFLCFAIAISMGYTLYQQQMVIQKQEKDMDLIKDHLEGLYTNSARENARTYTIMDTIIRIFHYAKPHKGPTWNCPECAEIHDKSKGKKPQKKKEYVTIKDQSTTQVDIGIATLANVLQGMHKHSLMRDTVILHNVLKTQHHLKMHKQKHKMCPDCAIDNTTKDNVAFK
jgi:ribosomal protein L23